MISSTLFVKNNEGRVVQLETFFNLFPGMENSLRILFGGKVLESMDEISGSLANLYLAEPNKVAIHAGEEVLFLEPIRSGEAGKVIARIALVTDKIICVYIEVWGGKPNEPEQFTRRYAGFGLCAVVDENGKMVRDLRPYNDGSAIANITENVVSFQRELRKVVLKTGPGGQAC